MDSLTERAQRGGRAASRSRTSRGKVCNPSVPGSGGVTERVTVPPRSRKGVHTVTLSGQLVGGFRLQVACFPVHSGCSSTRRQSPGRWKFLDLTACLSRSHLKSPATAGTCQEALPRHQHDSAKRCGPWPWGQVLIQPSSSTVCNSGTSTAPQVGDLLHRSIEGSVEAQFQFDGSSGLGG